MVMWYNKLGELRERYRLHDSLEAATSSATSCCSSKSHPSNGILSAEYFTQMKYEKPLTAAANLMNNNCLANDADKQSPTAIDGLNGDFFIKMKLFFIKI